VVRDFFTAICVIECSRTTVVVTMEKLAAARQKQFTTMSIERSLVVLITAICATECSRTTVVVTMEKLAAAQKQQFTTMSIERSHVRLITDTCVIEFSRTTVEHFHTCSTHAEDMYVSCIWLECLPEYYLQSRYVDSLHKLCELLVYDCVNNLLPEGCCDMCCRLSHLRTQAGCIYMHGPRQWIVTLRHIPPVTSFEPSLCADD